MRPTSPSASRLFKFLPAVAFLSIALILFGAYWPKTSSADTCTVCHKQTTTLMFDCDSLDYRRHKDHGDPDGACNSAGG